MAERDGRWVRLSAQYATDPRVMRLTVTAELLWVRHLTTTRQLGTDGHLTTEQLPLITRGMERRTVARAVAQLVEVGLWEQCDDGWRIPFDRWARWQTTTADWDAQRERERERKQKQRARLRAVREEEGRWA